MSDSLEKYLEKSSCSHCFNIDSECDKCIEKLLAEHDVKVRADAIDEFVEKADAEIYQDFNRTDVGEYTIADVALTIRRVAEQLKEKKND